MLESCLSDFSYIKETLDKEGDPDFFGMNFPFFLMEPILFYNSEKDIIVYMNNNFIEEFNYSVEDLAKWEYSIYPLLSNEAQDEFKKSMKSILENEEATIPDANYRLLAKNNKYNYYRVKVRKLHKSYYFIQFENSLNSIVPVFKNKTIDDLMSDAESILNFGIWMLDKVTDKSYWTKGIFNLLQYDNIEDVSPNLSLLYDSIIKDEAYLDFERRLNNGNIKKNYSIQYKLRTVKNNIVVINEYGRLEYDDDGNIIRITGLMKDITLQEQNMRNLIDYQSMMQENETFLNYGTWESNSDGSEVSWTNGMYKIYGYDDDIKINKDFYSKLRIGLDSGEPMETSNTFSKDLDSYHQEYEIKDEKGEGKILSTYAKVIHDNEGSIQKIIGTTRDITQLKEYEKILENKIAELNRSNTELEEFAYVASHDLQEPLRKISTFGNRLKTLFSVQLGDEGVLNLVKMLNAAENMRNLIDNLLEFSRISRSNQLYEEVDLSKTIQYAMEDLDMSIAETGTNISASPMPVIKAIPSQMRQLFFNLLHNAIKFRKGDTELVVNILQKKIGLLEKNFFHLPLGKEYYLITLTDNGIGFEQQYAKRIFQLFQRLEGKFEYPGTGIGLSICKKIVSNHKGLIFASSETRKGTIFSIILPQH